jgi:hypothetical protein
MLSPHLWCFAQIDLPDICQGCQQDVSNLKVSDQLVCRHCHVTETAPLVSPLTSSICQRAILKLGIWSHGHVAWSGWACEVAGYAAPTRQLLEQLRARERQCERASPDIAAAAPLSTAPRLCPLEPGMSVYNVGLPNLSCSPTKAIQAIKSNRAQHRLKQAFK